jgi:hypothetical protein
LVLTKLPVPGYVFTSARASASAFAAAFALSAGAVVDGKSDGFCSSTMGRKLGGTSEQAPTSSADETAAASRARLRTME